jgi:hypothetical protein
MKENVLEVLMYLFETYIDADEEPEPETNYPGRDSPTGKSIARSIGSTASPTTTKAVTTIRKRLTVRASITRSKMLV